MWLRMPRIAAQGISGRAVVSSGGRRRTASPITATFQTTAFTVFGSRLMAGMSSPSTNAWHSAVASSTGGRRTARSGRSEDIHRLGKDSLAKLRQDGAAEHEVHGTPEPLLDEDGRAREGVQPDRPLALDEEVHLAPATRPAADDGAEQGERADGEALAQLALVGPQGGEDALAVERCGPTWAWRDA